MPPPSKHGEGNSAHLHNNHHHHHHGHSNNILFYGFIFLFVAATVPSLLLINNIYTNSQSHSIWWLKSNINLLKNNIRTDKIDSSRKSSTSIATNIFKHGKDHVINPELVFKNDVSHQRKPLSNKAFSAVKNGLQDSNDFYKPLIEAMQYLTKPAFCSDFISYPFETGIFRPETQPYQPWVFDATVSSDRNFANIVLMDADWCTFNEDDWYRLVGTSRENSGLQKELNWLGNGSDDSIYAWYPDKILDKKLFTDANFADKSITCNYYDARNQLLGSEISLPITKGLLVRCPIPMQIRKLNTKFQMRLLSASVKKEEKDLMMTKMFSVCSNNLDSSVLDKLYANSSKSGELKDEKNNQKLKFDLAICTSTGTHHQAQLYEWIEFHRMLGVKHFFIYDRHIYKHHRRKYDSDSKTKSNSSDAAEVDDTNTLGGGDDDDDTIKFTESSMIKKEKEKSQNPNSKIAAEVQDDLETILEDFIDAGIVTIVPWPYKDCSDHMACDHTIRLNYSSPDRFEVPKRLQHHAAMASCYQRFKPFSSWILTLETFEFLGIKKDSVIDNRPIMSLIDIISAMESTHSNLAAIEVSAKLYLSCRTKNEGAGKLASLKGNPSREDEEEKDMLPRLSIPWYEKRSEFINSKALIINTKMVVTFQDNFLLHVEVADEGVVGATPKLRRVDLYQPGSDMSGSIPGGQVMYSHFIAKKAARRGGANAKAGEFSIAELDSKVIRVFELRMIENICDKGLIEYRSMKEVCREILGEVKSAAPSSLIHLVGEDNFFSQHFVDLTHRYSFALDGNIP